jgi:hypothetical protein
MSLRLAGAVVACAAALATGMAAGPTSAAAGYVPHRCYVSDLAARFYGSQEAWGIAASC